MRYVKKAVIIKNGDRKIYGEAHFPSGGAEAPFVIFSHGFNGGFRDFSAPGEYLAERGIGSYSFDFCGGSMKSRSSLKTTDMTLFTEKEDLIAVIQDVLRWEQVDRDRLFLFGSSQGGLVSALAAEESRDQIKGMMLLFPAFCIPEDWNARFPDIAHIPDSLEFWDFTLGRAFVESIHDFDVFEHMGTFDKDVLIFHGDRDEIVDISYGEKAASLYGKAELIVFPGEGHGFSEAGDKKLYSLVSDFVEKRS